MSYRDYEPPEPEAEGDDTFTCSSEVERKFITPEMERILRSFGDKPIDPWASTRSEEDVEKLRVRMMESRIASLLREWQRIEPMTRTCGWEGEAHYIVERGMVGWTCSGCGEEHDDERAEDKWGEDPDAARDRWLEDEADRMREDRVIEMLREDEGG